MKTMKVLCLGAFTAAMVLLTGCTTVLPISKSLEVKTDFDKIDKSIMIVIDSGLANLEITEHSGLDTWVFKAGEAISTNVTRAMGVVFREVQVTSDLSEKGKYDNYLSVKLGNYTIKRAATIWATHSINLDIEYSISDKGGKELFATHSKGTGQYSKSSGEANTQFARGMVLGAADAGRARSSHNAEFALAWDNALASSLSQLLNDIKRHMASGSYSSIQKKPMP